MLASHLRFLFLYFILFRYLKNIFAAINVILWKKKKNIARDIGSKILDWSWLSIWEPLSITIGHDKLNIQIVLIVAALGFNGRKLYKKKAIRFVRSFVKTKFYSKSETPSLSVLLYTRFFFFFFSFLFHCKLLWYNYCDAWKNMSSSERYLTKGCTHTELLQWFVVNRQ